MNNVKIIFFDIDGTLIDMESKKITKKMLETLHRLQEKGIKICLATGRAPATLPVFEDIRFDAYLTFNGSLCYTENETIFSNPISQKDLQQLLRNAGKMGRAVSIATKERIASNGFEKDLATYFEFAHIELVVSPDFDQVAKEEIYQVMLGCRKEEYDLILSEVDNAKIAAWWDRAVDIIPADGGKGVGIQKMLDYFGIPKEEALAFGDGNNDIEMFQAVGTGVAMENASEALKAVSDEICPHVREDGIYQYCTAHHLI